MSIFHNFFNSIIELVIMLLGLYKWVVIFAALVTWVNPDPYNPVVRFLYKATEPALYPIRRFIGNRLGPIDISPIIVIFAIIFIQSFLRKTFHLY
ncbi:MAG TPA: YggT family protein [Nitrospirae bacterium]|nr:YGGT family protein [bacterium BMS3Abin09]GBE41814.1 YGGT family protein [bacterium BMS3Bbin09]HDH34076.1 YggT family protein [Nitrospirota bacterium]HDO67582.1 YggT family protein [Nitrospirota bacterium]HDZ84733.1 YggT family protein [Nitrospirota bacterium]